MNVFLSPLKDDDREQFIIDNQEAFSFGALEAFGFCDSHMDEEEIISKETVDQAIDAGVAYRIMLDENKVGGVVVHVREDVGVLTIFFVKPIVHNMGIGQAVWWLIEKMYSQVKIWETMIPYFEKHTVHFYVNCCGFHIVEFLNGFHRASGSTYDYKITDEDEIDGMFVLRKAVI